MAGNKTLQKFKDSKIPKKGTGKIIIEIPIYKEPNTKSEIIGTIPKGQEITWISKSICDEREWIRSDEKNNFGYIVGYEKDGKCNIDIGTIKEKKNDKKRDSNFRSIPNEIVPITKEEIDIGNEALKEILFDDDKKDDKNNESQSISTEIDDINKSGFSDDNNKIPKIKKEEKKKSKEEGNDKWDNFYFEEDVSKIDSVVNENNKLLSEILNQIEEENKNDKTKSEKKDGNKEENDNSVSKAVSSILDVIPGKEKLSEKNNLLDALNLIPGGKNSKKYESKKDNKKNEEEDLIKKSKTIALKGIKLPENFAKEGAGFKQAMRDAKRANNIPKSNQPINTKANEKINYDKRGKKQPGKVEVFKDSNNKEVELRIDSEGHEFKDGTQLGPHINDPSKRHFFYDPNKK